MSQRRCRWRQKVVGEARSDVSAGIVIATAMMYLSIDAVLALFNWHLALVLLPAMGGAFVALIAGWQWTKRERAVAPQAAKIPAMNAIPTLFARFRTRRRSP